MTTRFGPMTRRVFERIEDDIKLMRWSEQIDKPGEIRSGSLADTFWNRDIPRLVAAVEKILRERPQV